MEARILLHGVCILCVKMFSNDDVIGGSYLVLECTDRSERRAIDRPRPSVSGACLFRCITAPSLLSGNFLKQLESQGRSLLGEH